MVSILDVFYLSLFFLVTLLIKSIYSFADSCLTSAAVNSLSS